MLVCKCCLFFSSFGRADEGWGGGGWRGGKGKFLVTRCKLTSMHNTTMFQTHIEIFRLFYCNKCFRLQLQRIFGICF